MSSKKFRKLAHDIALRDRNVFNQLVEFEETGRIQTKTRLNFTIDKKIARQFKGLCRDKGYNMSAKIEKAMKEMVLKDS